MVHSFSISHGQEGQHTLHILTTYRPDAGGVQVGSVEPPFQINDIHNFSMPPLTLFSVRVCTFPTKRVCTGSKPKSRFNTTGKYGEMAMVKSKISF